MRVLLDTHFIIWMAMATDELRPAEVQLIDQHRDNLITSVVSLWELRTKWEAVDRRGRRKGRLSPKAAADYLRATNIVVESLTRDVILEQLKSPINHADPFDRMLLIHAQHLGARLLTRDRRLVDHPLSLPL